LIQIRAALKLPAAELIPPHRFSRVGSNRLGEGSQKAFCKNLRRQSIQILGFYGFQCGDCDPSFLGHLLQPDVTLNPNRLKIRTKISRLRKQGTACAALWRGCPFNAHETSLANFWFLIAPMVTARP
jgi:hypothetical protein